MLLPTCALLLVELARVWNQRADQPTSSIGERLQEARRAARPTDDIPGQHARELSFAAWLLGLVAGSLLLGVAFAIPLFLLLWFVAQARQGWAGAVAVAASAALFVDILLPWGFGLRLPRGLLGPVLAP